MRLTSPSVGVPGVLAVLIVSVVALLGVASSGLACSGEAGSEDGGVDVREEAPPAPDGGVFLTSLSVSFGSLKPEFAWDITDYYVPCVAGANSGSVSMAASAGADSELLQPSPPSAPKPSQTLSVTVNEGQAIVAEAVRGQTTKEYWVRCLPHDFPTMQWEPHPSAGTPAPGYYLVGDAYPIPNLNVGWAIVLDNHGVPVWFYKEPGDGVYDTDSLSPGAITFFPSPPNPNAGSLPWELHPLSPPSVKGIGPGGADTDNHELRFVSKTGHYFLYSIPIDSGYDLSSLTIAGASHPLSKSENVALSVVLEIDPTSATPTKPVWSWNVKDHFDPNTSCTYPRPGANNWHAAGNTQPVFDVFHLNSIDVDTDSAGNPIGLLLSARNMDSLFYVEYPSGKVLWKMGGTTSCKDPGVTFLRPLANPFYRQHDARLLPGWSSTTCGGHGQISMFDDQTDRGDARGVVYDVTVKEDGSATCAASAATIAWEYDGQGDSAYMGSFRIQPDGSRVIGWGTNTVSGLIFSEVDPAQNDMLDLYFQPGVSYRAIKVPLTALDLAAMRMSAGVQVNGW